MKMKLLLPIFSAFTALAAAFSMPVNTSAIEQQAKCTMGFVFRDAGLATPTAGVNTGVGIVYVGDFAPRVNSMEPDATKPSFSFTGFLFKGGSTKALYSWTAASGLSDVKAGTLSLELRKSLCCIGYTVKYVSKCNCNSAGPNCAFCANAECVRVAPKDFTIILPKKRCDRCLLMGSNSDEAA